MTQLAGLTRLGRTTVSNALNQAEVPSARTVARMAKALRLNQEELLELRRQAAAEREEPDEPQLPGPAETDETPDPAVEDATVPEGAPAPGGRTGPVTLPPLAKEFTGRAGELRDILDRLDPAASASRPADVPSGTARPATVVVSAVMGMGGVGKTALALQAAHRTRLRGWFPGGILFANLYGYSPHQERTPGEVADQFLGALGVRSADIPVTAQGKLDTWRIVLDRLTAEGRPLLVVLDNVRSAGQVSALLPQPPHRGLVTSRHSLPALQGHCVHLAPLTPQEAVDLVQQVLCAGGIRDDRVSAEPEAAARLAELCGYLPLALEIIAALLRSEPSRSLESQTEELTAARNRLSVIEIEETDAESRPMAVRASFELSYRHLTEPQAAAFRLLAAAPGPDVSSAAVAALLGDPGSRRLLAELSRAHLLTGSRDRWSMHDLIRLYAEEQGDAHSDGDRRDAALTRLLEHYRTISAEADTHLTGVPGNRSPRFGGRRQALEWLDAEHTNLVAAATAAPQLGHPSVAVALAGSLSHYLGHRRYFDDWITLSTIARDVSGEDGDLTGEGTALDNLGLGLRHLRKFEKAVAAHTEAAGIFRQLGDRGREVLALNHIGIALSEQGRTDKAIAAYTRAREILALTGDQPHLTASVVGNLGAALREAGRYEEAITAHTQAAETFRRIRDESEEGAALTSLGGVLQHVGRYKEAIDAHSRAVRIHARLDDPHREAAALNNLGGAWELTGRTKEAISAFTGAAEIFRALGDQYSEALALSNLGDALRQTDPEEAVSTLTRAARILRESGADGYEARVSHSLGKVLLALGRNEEAVTVFSRAALLCRGSGDHGNEGASLLGSADALDAADRPDEAADSCAQAAAAFERAGDDPARGWALTNLAGALLSAGRTGEALSAADAALEHNRRVVTDESVEYTHVLAHSLMLLAWLREEEQQNLPGSLSAAMEAAGLLTPLAAAQPETFAARLREALEQWAHVLDLLHRTREAGEVRRRLERMDRGQA
ncbi:tetratricopeptide repeat protein [Streptomyces sp. Caat 7-52]|uniref:ATP-binding protein n=1 Tax=Streptomyces sp. Caat 7-52 TaxID=2949637 RepID=UPI00203634AA|nr:tetratricopeptide repeat protein [Streptomyces sp. Caat 7-52]